MSGSEAERLRRWRLVLGGGDRVGRGSGLGRGAFGGGAVRVGRVGDRWALATAISASSVPVPSPPYASA